MKIHIANKTVENVFDDKTIDVNSGIDSSGERLCYTCFYQNTVTVLSSDLNIIFTFEDDNI